jgi:L-lactate dehydrogenase (cytochrome)
MDELTHLEWCLDVRLRGGPISIGNLPKSAPVLKGLPSMRKWVGTQCNPYLSSNDFDWVRSHWDGKIVIKGILEPEDALLAKKMGADGIVVSNHGGRHIDSTSSTIQALPKIVDVLQGSLKVLFDGGITNGLDIIKALALGADFCMIGKPWLYGLASRGENGVSDILAILQNEMKIAITHLGISSLQNLNRSIICS